LHAAEVPKALVPSSPFLPLIYRYADTMLEHGRDTYGPQKTGLFLSALDRATLAPLTNRPPAPAGIRESDRVGPNGTPLRGGNPQHDENLLRLLYTLTDLSQNRKYREAADTELKWFLEQAASTNTHLLPWGEHMSWDVFTDQPIAANGEAVGTHEFFRPWLLWDRCFELAPEASRQFAMGLWEHQIADQQTGAYNRHAGYWKHAATDGMDFPRHAGFYIRTWASVYAHARDPALLKAIEVVLMRFERKRHPQTGLIESQQGEPNCAPALTLSLAIDCDAAADRVPEPLAGRLRGFAAREDEIFCALPHPLPEGRGFLTSVEKSTGKAAQGVSPLWDARYGGFTTGQIALMCVARYDRAGKVSYRNLITNAANVYFTSKPPAEVDLWPMTLGHAISLQLAAWRHTAQPEYLRRAREFGSLAVEVFLKDSPLPAASSKCAQYETITGADSLALSLVDLHLQILAITAVSCPPNTIDR
jgi:hypothetical protein